MLNINGHDIILEADGSQHFKVSEWLNKEKLAKSMKRDILKDQYAMNNKINMIRIPHNMINQFQNILRELITKCTREFKPFLSTYKHYADELSLNPEMELFIIPSPRIEALPNEYRDDEDNDDDDDDNDNDDDGDE